jgi:cytochrome P450
MPAPNTPVTPAPASAALPPAYRGWPVVGAVPALLRQQLDFFFDAHKRYGDVYALDLGPLRFIMLNAPQHAQHVLRDRVRNYDKGVPFWDSIRRILGDGLPVSEGSYWMRQRRMMQPHFHKERLASMVDLMVDCIDERLEQWEKWAASGEPVDMAQEFAHLAMSVGVRSLFGSAITAQEAELVSRQLAWGVDYLLFGMFATSLPGWLPVPGRKRFEGVLRDIDGVVMQVIERHRTQQSVQGGSLVGMLLDMVDTETGERMTDRQMRDEAVSLFIGAYETTAVTLTMTMSLLAEHPQVAQALRQELESVLGGQRPGFTHLPRLTLAYMTVQEGLRLYPALYWYPRRAVEEDVIDGYRIPAGSYVSVMTSAVQRHPEHWEHPERFDPWRFSPERSANRHPLAWLPFGAGQRLCIGKEFAMMEGQLVLARILSRFDVEPIPERPVSMRLGVVMHPRDGAWMRVRRRSSPQAQAAAGVQAAAGQ